MDDSRFANVDLKGLLSRLYAAAEGLFVRKGLSVLPGSGKSAEDLAVETVEAFIFQRGVEWRPKTPDEDPYPLLLTVMTRDFLDIVTKHSAYKTSTVLDSLKHEKALHVIDAFEDDLCNAEHDALTKARIYALVKGEKELEDYVEAVLALWPAKQKEIAEFLGISAQQLRGRQRRVRTRLTGWQRARSMKYRQTGN